MEQINWSKFGLKGESKNKSFEDLCMFLCCRQLKITKIESYKNQPGIETEPFEVEGKRYGFQAKFFDESYGWDQVKASILGAEDKTTKSKKIKYRYPNNVFEKYNLSKIFIYSNKEKTKSSTEKLLDELKIDYIGEIEYITDKDFQLKLSQPSNLDLAQLYFGIGDELGFIKGSMDPILFTLIQSSEHLEIPLSIKDVEVTDLGGDIMTKDKKIFLISGNPGSGKSILSYKLLEVFGGLNAKDEQGMQSVLTKNGAIPVLIKLRNCIIDSLDSIITRRKHEYNIKRGHLKFIYILDGLDELDEGRADIILSQIDSLNKDPNTKKVIVSCRSGNLNKLKIRGYFSDIEEYRISNLSISDVQKYFTSKGIHSKLDRLKELSKNNEKFIKEANDIFMIRLLWDTIEDLSENSTIIDLFDKKISLLLTSPEHKKDIESLNLLNDKKQEIVELNQDISFKFQKKFQFRFSQKELQELILRKFDRLDYCSTNSILNYIASLFFDGYDYTNDLTTSFIYQHRRYQEYFFTQRLKIEFEKNPQILRELRVVSNREYLEEILLPYLKKEYKREDNLPGLIELNLIDVYLGKHEGFGADDTYYMNSREFIPTLISQNIRIFNELLEDENLQIRKKVSINFNELKKQFLIWNKDKEDYNSQVHLENIWERGVSSLLEVIVSLWRADKKEVAKDFVQQLEDLIKLYKTHDFYKNLKKGSHMKDPFWSQFEYWIYYRVIIREERLSKVFDELILRNYQNLSEERRFDGYDYEEKGKEKLVKSFLRFGLEERKDDLFNLIDSFDEYQFTCLLEIFITLNYLPIFIEMEVVQGKIKSYILNNLTQDKENISYLFFKKYFQLEISENEKQFLTTRFSNLRERRGMDWHMYKTPIDIGIISYILDRFSFEEFLAKQDGYNFRYQNELGLYSALFRDYILLLKSEKTAEAIVRDYIRYITLYNEGAYHGKYLKVDISFLWAHIFSINSNPELLIRLKSILVKEENDIIPFSFLLKLRQISEKKFSLIINRNDLTTLEQELANWSDDFPSYVDRCFNLSLFLSGVDPEKARFYFTKAVLEGTLRHGWHKDTIVSYLLTDAFEIIWKNNWIDHESKKKYAEEVFNLVIRVTHITDGDHTWRGPYLVVKIISETDIILAEKFKKILIDDKGYSNVSNSVITYIILAKVRLGIDITSVEEAMEEFRKDYQYDGKPMADFYEQKFIVYLEIAQSDLYTEDEKIEAFKKSYEQIEEIKKGGIDYYLRDSDFKKEKEEFQNLCKKYKVIFNLEYDKPTDHFKLKVRHISEDAFIKEIKTCTNKKQLTGKYKKLDNYKNDIVLKKSDSWKILIEKTFEIFGDAKPFIRYIKKNNFPHSDYWTSNSAYYHLALAEGLRNKNTKEEILEYIIKNSGHGGFKNIIKTYEAMEDKDMCLRLFDRYLHFCKLIVN